MLTALENSQKELLTRLENEERQLCAQNGSESAPSSFKEVEQLNASLDEIDAFIEGMNKKAQSDASGDNLQVLSLVKTLNAHQRILQWSFSEMSRLSQDLAKIEEEVGSTNPLLAVE